MPGQRGHERVGHIAPARAVLVTGLDRLGGADRVGQQGLQALVLVGQHIGDAAAAPLVGLPAAGIRYSQGSSLGEGSQLPMCA
jgi:hypothetical protein